MDVDFKALSVLLESSSLSAEVVESGALYESPHLIVASS